MSKKNTEHVIMRSGGGFCSHCGEKYVPQFPLLIKDFASQLDIFIENHTECEKIWVELVADQSKTLDERIDFWLEHGDTGISSKTIVSRLSPRTLLPQNRWSHPRDAGDFNRCHKLLETIPEFRAKLVKMAEVSDVWAKLVENWTALTELLEAKNYGELNEFMRSLGC